RPLSALPLATFSPSSPLRPPPPFPTRRSSDLDRSCAALAATCQIGAAPNEVGVERADGGPADRHQPLLAALAAQQHRPRLHDHVDRKSTRLNSSHVASSYAVFCLKKKQPTRKV